MKLSIKKGLSFGLTSGVITTLGLVIGLSAGMASRAIIISGIIIIAVSDALSDALGIHISEESDHKNNSKDIWEATISTFLSKFIIAFSFVLPVLFFDLKTAMFVSVLWGLFLIAIFSFYIALTQREKTLPIILEHVIIATIVIFITYYVGFCLGN